MSVSKIRTEFKHAICDCTDEGCSVDLADLSDYVPLKGEEVTGDSVCDCIIFHTSKKLAASLVELKSHSPDATQTVKQFENGTKQVYLILKKINFSKPCDVTFTLFAKSYRHSSEVTKLKSTKIKFCSKKYDIKLKKCGCKLPET